MTQLQPSEIQQIKVRILIVDDHPVVRHGLVQLIKEEADLSVCGEAEDAHQALQLIESQRPDLVIADLSLKGRPGLELIKDIEVRFPDLPVLVLSMHDETLWAERVLRAGASGYVMKQNATRDVLIAGIRRVLGGELYVSDAIGAKLMHSAVGARTGVAGSPLERLSDRELEVFQLIGRGLNNHEIAKALSLSVKTVDVHREHIKEKLQLRSSAELLRYATLRALEEC